MNPANRNYVPINTEEFFKKIKASGISASKLSKGVLKRDESYLTTVKTRGTMFEEDFNALCDFLSINPEDVTVKAEREVTHNEPITPSKAVNLDALILGINQLYQIEKSNNELIKEVVEQIKISNTKQSRLENVVGQIHTNLIIVKNTLDKIEPTIRDTKSSVVTIAGRVRDMLQKFK